jgi:hypothetical protein
MAMMNLRPDNVSAPTDNKVQIAFSRPRRLFWACYDHQAENYGEIFCLDVKTGKLQSVAELFVKKSVKIILI